MSLDEDFRAEIAAHPADRTVRLIYADWLEEHGDPRAELLRIEEEMRGTAVYADRFWELKARRRSVRRPSAEDWLRGMGYDTDYEPVFTAVPDGWKERWRLLREFTERWHGVPMNDVGARGEQIGAIEGRLGLVLPPSLGEWIAFGFELSERAAFATVLRDGFEVDDLASLNAVSLMLQGERDLYWAVRKEDLPLVDPPVRGYVLDWDSPERTRFAEQSLFAPHITTFVLQHASYFLNGRGGGMNVGVRSIDALLQNLERTFPCQARFDQLRIFETTNLIVLLGPMPHTENAHRLVVEAWRPLPRSAIPEFLWEYTRDGGAFRGPFVPSPRA